MLIKRLTSLSDKDASVIASIHLEQLDDSFLSQFGHQFLKSFYLIAIKNPKNILIIAKKTQLNGYLLATTDINDFYKSITLNHFFNFLPLILKKLITSPRLFSQLIHFPFSNKPNITPAELQFIAVSQNHQSKGIGRQLIAELMKEYQALSINQFCVGTKKDNHLSNQFYLKNHFKFKKTYRIFDSFINYYLIKF